MQTGIEIAGEAAEAGARSVTLAHSGDRIGASNAQHKVLCARLRRAGVRIVLSTHARVADGNGDFVTLDGKDAMHYDHVFWCTGSEVRAAFAESLGADSVQQGYINVNLNLQVCSLNQ